MIEIRDLTKKYGKFTAVEHMNLLAKDSEITILLGQNGAGKSTTIKSIAGLLSHKGEILIDNNPSTSLAAKRSFGYIPETPCFYDILTIEEHIHFIGKSYKIDHYEDYANELLERFELADKRKKMAKELSKGMTQKLSMLLALMTRPHTLMVDEPMVGLDPTAIEEVLKLFIELKEQGTSILISTHIIDIINDIWDSAYIMEQGHIIQHVTRQELDDKNETLKEAFFTIVGGK